MKKKIVIFILIFSMMVQNLEMVVRASNPVDIQSESTETDISDSVLEGSEQTGTESTVPEGNEQTDEADSVPEDGNNEHADMEDTTPDSENDGQTDTENTVPDSENDEQTDTENTVPEEDSEQTDIDNQGGEDPEVIAEDKEPTETSFDSMTDRNDEAVGTAAYAESESTEQNIPTMQYAQSDIANLAADNAAIKGVQGLYFGYIEEDSDARTGILSTYLSESGNIVLPHKLDNHYMVGIGDSTFANMNKTDSSDLSKLPKQSTSGKTLLSSGEQKILELVNAARIKEGKIPLVMSPTLRETARCKTLDMLNKNYFDHKNTDGTYTKDWLDNCGYVWYSWAENIAYNYDSAERLYTQWWNSSGHKKNMMNENLRAIGIGVYRGSDGRIMGTQVFSSTVYQNLTDVTIEYGYESIGSRAFYGCTNLTSITIPSSVTEIADNAFDGCGALTIRGKSGSYAQTFAETAKIPFQAVDEICPIKTFKYDQEEVFVEKGDMDSVNLIIEPADYRHLIREELPENQQTVRFLEDGAILALENGEVTIQASAADLTSTCRITVGDRKVPLLDISFYEEEIVLYEGESAKPVYRISPVDSTESVHLKSSNDNVFIIEENENQNAKITATHAGNAVLTASNDDGTVSAALNVKVLARNENLALPDDLKAMTNVGSTLADVSLENYPGFSWKEPQTKLKAKKAEPVQYFAAQYSDGDKVMQDCILPVSVSSASGLTASLEDKALVSGKKLSLSESYMLNIGVNATGAAADSSFYDVSCTIDQPTIAQIDNIDNNDWRITPKAAGKCNLTVEVKLKDAFGGYGPTKKPYGTYKKKYALQVEDKTYVKKIQILPEPEMSDGVRQLEDGSFVAEDGVTKFYVRAHAYDETGHADTVAETQFSFGTDKSGILQIKAVAGENGLAMVTVKKPGNSVITVTAKDNGKRTESVPVLVQNMSPQLKGKSWTLNKLKPKVTAIVDLQPSEINPIQDVELYEDRELQIKSALFTITKDNMSGSYMAGFQNQSLEQVTKSSYKLYLKVNTQAGKEYAYPFTIKLNSKKPSVTLKQTDKINLFYKDSDALLTIATGTDKVKNIEQINEAQDVPHFKVNLNKNNESWAGTIYPVNVTAQNYKKINKIVELRFTFEDYGEEFCITKKLTVKYNYQKAAIVTTPSEGLIYLKIGNDRAVFQLTDKTSKSALIPGGEDNVTVSLAENMNTKAELSAADGDPNIYVKLPGEKSLTVKTTVSHDNWRESVPCSFKLTVNKKVPSLTLEKTKLTFNSTAAGKETFTLKTSINKNETVSIVRLKDVDIVGGSSAAKKLLEEGKISICPQKQGDMRNLTVRLNDATVKNGTYKYQVYGWCMQGETKILRTNPATLSITVSNKQPAVSLKTKGKLKLSEPDNSVITYTPKLSNISGNIRTASVSGAYASAFQLISCDDGTYQLKLKRNDLTKGSYKLNLVFTLDNGVRVTSKAVTVKL